LSAKAKEVCGDSLKAGIAVVAFLSGRLNPKVSKRGLDEINDRVRQELI
jgi:hypothetical protein